MARAGCVALSIALAACRPAVERAPLAAEPATAASERSPAPLEARSPSAHRLAIGASQIRVRLEPDAFAGREAAVLGWIERCARAVASYYGAFPVPELTIEVRASRGSRIRGAQAFPSSPPRITISVGARAAAADFERTGGRHSLDEALRAIVAAGGNISTRWPLERALRAGDAATGEQVLLETYASMKDAPVQVDLGALWRKLGVALEAGAIRYDDTASLAGVRRVLVAGKR